MHSIQLMLPSTINKNVAHLVVHNKHCHWHMFHWNRNTTRIVVTMLPLLRNMTQGIRTETGMPTEMEMITIRVVNQPLVPLMPIAHTRCRVKRPSNNTHDIHNRPTVTPTTHKIVAIEMDAADTAAATAIITKMRALPKPISTNPISISCHRSENTREKLFVSMLITTKIKNNMCWVLSDIRMVPIVGAASFMKAHNPYYASAI